MSKRIVGNPGSDPIPGVATPAIPAAAIKTASLTIEGGRVFVTVNGEKIPLDAAGTKTILDGGGAKPSSAAAAKAPAELGKAIAAARAHSASLRKPGVVNVRAGYLFDKGRITDRACVVVEVDPLAVHPSLPSQVDGVPVQVTSAGPRELLAHSKGTEAATAAQGPRLLIDDLQGQGEESAEAFEVARTITYEPPAGASLPEVEEAMAITCHVSPDAGWGVLEPFLKGTQSEFVLGMYDFTAPHIYQTARSLLRDSGVSWTQTLGPNESLPNPDEVDSNKANDLTEDSIVTGLTRVAAERFESAFAHVGKGQTFASAYHIKVGVRDHAAFWLSSGNWQSSNQPDIDFLAADADRQLIPKFNREWHVVVENKTLAGIFETYLNGDFKTASAGTEAGLLPVATAKGPDLLIPESELLFEERAAANIQVFAPKRFVFSKQKPLKIQPILTPDNYLDIVLDLLRKKPSKTLYFQNQSLNPVVKPTPEFAELMQLLADYSNDENLDVRLIFRDIGAVRKKLESLKAAGFNMDRIRMQGGCHTKGIIIDSEVILLGSHNCTNDGVQFNRDASLLMFDAGIAQYYQDVFLHDWERLARPTVRPESAILAEGAEAAPAGLARVSWSYYDELD